MVPTLDPDTPRVLRLRTPEYGAARLAEAMLAEGMLAETDWAGGITETIGAGLTRWVLEQLGGRDLRRVTFGLHWTDNLESLSRMDLSLWRSRPGVDPRAPIGLVALCGEPDAPPADLVVGRTVLALNAWRPGLGWQVLNLLGDALPGTLCVAMPFWAREQVVRSEVLAQRLGHLSPEMLAAVADEADLVLPGHGISLREFDAAVPAETYRSPVRPGVIREAQRHTAPPELAEIVKLAGEVERCLQRPARARQWDTHGLATHRTMFIGMPGGAAVLSPFAVRWSATDPIRAVVDDYHRQVSRRGEETDLAWSQAWQATQPEGVRKAVRHWKLAARLALKAALLAELMHSEEEL